MSLWSGSAAIGDPRLPTTPEEREKLRLTIAGLVNAALMKFPQADPGTPKQLWAEEVDRSLKGKAKGGRSRAKVPPAPLTAILLAIYPLDLPSLGFPEDFPPCGGKSLCSGGCYGQEVPLALAVGPQR